MVPHYLLDMVDPDIYFSVADWQREARIKVEDLLSQKKLPLITGGTGLFLSSIVKNYELSVDSISRTLREELSKLSLSALQQRLQRIDSTVFSQIDQQNSRRLIRAIEVKELTGKSITFSDGKKHDLFQDEPLRSGTEKEEREVRWNILQIGLQVDREILYQRINQRVDQMMDAGLLDEVRALSEYYSWSLPSMSGIGYKQLGMYLRGEMSLTEAVELIKRDTRRYAKRQLTWWRRDESIEWLSADEIPGRVERFLK